jgi:hypothetical protein
MSNQTQQAKNPGTLELGTLAFQQPSVQTAPRMTDTEYFATLRRVAVSFELDQEIPGLSDGVLAARVLITDSDQNEQLEKAFLTAFDLATTWRFPRELLDSKWENVANTDRDTVLAGVLLESYKVASEQIPSTFLDVTLGERDLSISGLLKALVVAQSGNYVGDPRSACFRDERVRKEFGASFKSVAWAFTQSVPRPSRDTILTLGAHRPDVQISNLMGDITALCFRNNIVNDVLRSFRESKAAQASFAKPIAIVADITPVDASDLNEPTRKLAITHQGLSIVSLRPNRYQGVTYTTDEISLIDAKRNSTEAGQRLNLDCSGAERGIGIRRVAEILPVLDVEAVQHQITANAAELKAYAEDPHSWIGDREPRLKNWPTLPNDLAYALALATGLRTGNYEALGSQPLRNEFGRCLAESPLMNTQAEGRFFGFLKQARDEFIPLAHVRWTGSTKITAEEWFEALPRYEILPEFTQFFRLDGNAVMLRERAVSFVVDRIDPENRCFNDAGSDDPARIQRQYSERPW